MTDNVIPHNFGKEDREHARRLHELLKLVAERDEDLLANPGKYFEMASKRIAQLQGLFHQMDDALLEARAVQADYRPDQPPRMPDTITIDRRDFDALQKIKAIIQAART